MIESRPFRVLGLSADAGEAEIRKAYAQRLKTTHPEDNPEGFKELRSAYEMALQEVRYRAQYGDADEALVDGSGEPSPEEDASAPGAPAASGAVESDPSPGARDAAPRDPPSEEDAHAAVCNRLGAALQSGANADELHAALDAVLASPMLANVDVYNRTESWLIHLLANSAPASYPLLDRAISHFQWHHQVGDHRNWGPAAILTLRERIPREKVSADFLKRVRDRRHEFHRAYKETMRSPADRGWLSRVWSLRRHDLVDRFLTHIERRAPLAIEALDADAVYWWRNRKRGPLRWLLAFGHLSQYGLYVAMIVAGGYLVLVGLDAFKPTEQAAATWLRTRAECERAMANIESGRSNREIDTAIAAAERICRRELAAAPDSLVLSQHVGLIALAAGRPEEALERFDSILALSPNDPYALFGKGLAASDTALLGEAVKRAPEVTTYFLAFPVRIPVATPMTGELKSRWEKRLKPTFDTQAEKISGPSDPEMQDLLKHFSLRRTPVGEAVLDCVVGADGGVSDCVIVKETPFNKGVGEFALRMAMASKFKPAKLKGEAVDRVPVNYTITLIDGSKGAAPIPRAPSAGDYVQVLEDELRSKTPDRIVVTPSGPSSAPAAPPPPARVLTKEGKRIAARSECETAMQGLKTVGTAQRLGEAMARADKLCQRELQLAPDSLVLTQHVAVIQLLAGRSADAIAQFDAILALSPNDPYALYGRQLAVLASGAAADTGTMAEAVKRDPKVEEFYSEYQIGAPDVTPLEEAPKSRLQKRPMPEIDTQIKKLSGISDAETMDLLMHFGVRETPVGKAVLECLAGADGGISDCVIIEEAPLNRGMGEFAIRMAMASKFEPAKLNGATVDRVPFKYTITLVDPAVDEAQKAAEAQKADHTQKTDQTQK